MLFLACIAVAGIFGAVISSGRILFNQTDSAFLGGKRRQHPHPTANAAMEAFKVVFLVGAVDHVVDLGEADQQGVEPQYALEIVGYRNRTARTGDHRRLAPFV